ncbi:MAG TPA: DUF4159 domain-containing protein [Gemmataceae bacterium]|nr:DUF4159 domain-containing protein [Gemmataceae bacterium]
MCCKLVRVSVVAALALLTLVPLRAAEKSKEPLVERVRKAIDAGVRYLRDQEKGTGNWEAVDKSSVGMPGGWSSLAMLAMLNAGVRPDDPIIERGLKYLRTVERRQTYVVSLQTMVFAETGRNEDRQRIQANVDWLIAGMVRENGRCKGWGYGNTIPNNHMTDNSNTQYALLGLHAGRQAGAKIEREVWQAIQDYYVETQRPDHGWIYNSAMQERTLTMTTAGLCGLLISGMELNAGREVLRPDGTATNCGVYAENKPATDALGWIAGKFQVNLRRHTYYNLYGIERAGRLSGQRFFGKYDWYREGCEFLVGAQREDGSWQETDGRDGWPIISTSFALLFLSKGRTPILISKLAHGPGEDWNNDRNDARNLVEYASKEVFRKLPLAWQIFDTRRIEAPTDEAVLGLVGDLLQSPIVYFNGHKDPRLTGVQKKLLQQYVEQGGFILAEACCGQREFDQGFRALMRELFPDNPLKKLGPEHPIWRAHAAVPPGSFALEGIDLGCKTVVIYSPQDLSCLWEANQVQGERALLAFRLGGNIIAYATGMEPPKARGTQVEVIHEDAEGKEIPRGFLKVAQLRHDGDWHPAPNAMRTLMDHLRKSAQLDVTLQTKAVYANDPDLVDFKFLYMHGRANFVFSPEAVKNLRTQLEMGGLLFADACCGQKAFDTSFRDLVSQLFPDRKLEPIPLTDDLYSKEVNGSAVTTVRCRTTVPGDFRELAPYLEGIKVGNRWAIIYSKYDIGCALEKHQSTDCLGHDHDSALRLGSAAVLYALKR